MAPCDYFRNVDLRKYLTYWGSAVTLTAVGLWMAYAAVASESMSAGMRALYAVADAMVWLLPLVWVSRKWLYAVPAWGTLLAVVIEANLLYARNFNDCIAGISYFASGTVNPFVISTSLSSLRAADMTLLLSIGALWMLTARMRRSYSRSNPGMAVYAALAVMLFAAQCGASVRRQAIYSGTSIPEAFDDYRDGFRQQTAWKGYVAQYGFPGYLVRAMKDNFRTPVRLSARDITLIDDFRRNYRPSAPLPVGADSMLSLNSGKNLILIIVESLNAKALTLPEAPLVAPNLTRLAADTAVLHFPRIEAMTGHGRSSDGQFLYNTGMLPLREEALINRYASAPYPSLAKILGRESTEIIGEDRSVWNHGQTSLSYGFSRLIDNTVPFGTPIAEMDSLIFARALRELPRLQRPFYLEVTTIGMHKPYGRDTGVDLPLPPDSYTAEDRHYLEALHAFDRALGDFLDSISRSGQAGESVIVIAADHEEMYPMLSERFTEKTIPAFILGSGMPRAPRHSAAHIQADLFPTVLDAIGRTSTEEYRGMGRSMLRDTVATTFTLPRLWEISEIQIKSRQFPCFIPANGVNH